MISGQMIVYFLQKSKIGQGGVFLGSVLVSFYVLWVFSQVLLGSRETLQIVKSTPKYSQSTPIEPQKTPVVPAVSGGEYQFVASKRGKYYYPKSCSKAKSLSIANMLYFKDKIAAEAAGYVPHSGC